MFGVGLFVLWLTFLVAASLVAVAAVGLSVWTLVDASRRPDQQFAAAGVDRTQWIVLASVGLAVCQPVGLVVAIIYLTSIRRRLDAVAQPHVGDAASQRPHPQQPKRRRTLPW